MNIGQLMRDLRHERGITLKELADKIDISPSYLSALERDLRKPSIQVLKKIGATLNIPVSYLIGSEENVITGSKLRYMRESRGLSLEDLSEICDIALSRLIKYEDGLESPDLEDIKKLSEGLNITIKYFLDQSNNSKSLGTRLKKVRVDRGLTSTALAEKANVSAGLISQIESGLTTPTLETLQNIARALNTSPSYFLLENKDVEDLLTKLSANVIELLGDPNVQAVLRSLSDFQPDELKYLINYIDFFRKNKSYIKG